MAPVDEEVHSEPERHAHHADDVLDHTVGGGKIQRMPAGRQGAEIAVVQYPAIMHGAHALVDAELVKLGNPQPIICHSACSSTTNPCSSTVSGTT